MSALLPFFRFVLVLGLFGLSTLGWALEPCQRLLLDFDFKGGTRALETIHEFRITTYNVENLFLHVGKFALDPDAERGSHIEKIKPEKDKPIEKLIGIAEAIKNTNPDAAVLEEVENIEGLSAWAKDHLQDQYRPILLEGNDPRGIDIAFLVKRDLPFDIEVQGHKNETWIRPNVPGAQATKLFSRDLPALLIRARGAAKTSTPLMIILGTHYKSKRPSDHPKLKNIDPTSNIQRQAQVERTLEIIEDYRKQFGREVPLMLAGDFNGAMNSEPEFAGLKKLAKLEDAFNLLKIPPSTEDRITHVYFPPDAPADQKQLDAVFLSESLIDSVIDATVYRYLDSKTGKPKPLPTNWKDRDSNPSDHWPVTVTIKFDKLAAKATQ